MANRQGGFRRRTRSKFTKDRTDKGKISHRDFLQKFKEGDKVKLIAEPAYQKGMYYPRYHGFEGMIKGQKGECYNVEISDHGRAKVLIVHPVHLRRT